jgi:hypothetical protein
MPDVATELDFILQAQFTNQIVQTIALWTLTSNYAMELQSGSF